MYQDDLQNFRTLNAALKDATEAECENMLSHEKAHGKRAQFLVRIYGRLNKLRATRERLELLKTATK